MSFCCPSAHQASKVHSTRVLPARYVPSSGFGYPLDGLLPSKPCRLYFAPAALLGFSLRSVSSPQATRTFPTGLTHIPFWPDAETAAEAAARHAGTRFLGFVPAASPCPPRRVFSTPARGSSPGFFLSRALGQPPCPGFRRNSSLALGDPWTNPQCLRHRVSIGGCLA